MTGTEIFSFHESDLDGARDAIRSNYFDTSLDLVGRGRPYEFRFSGMARRSLSVGDCFYTAGMQIDMSDLGTCYYVNFPAAGHMDVEHRGASFAVGPTRAAVFRPIGGIAMRTSDDYRSFAVRIESGALEDALEHQLGRSVRRPLELAPNLEIGDGAGRSWARLVRLIAAEPTSPGGLLSHDVTAAPMQEALLRGLLFSVEHPYRDALAAPVRSWGPGPVKRTVEAMEATPDHPFTVAELARIALASVRSLQEAFRRHLGTTPMSYLQELRLACAHDALVRADPTAVTVSQVALRCGFAHPGRFSLAYRANYGIPPSETLRHSRIRSLAA